MTAKTLRRKNQKKAKRRRYSRCSKCGGRAVTFLAPVVNVPVKRCFECGNKSTNPWRGGGTGRRIPRDATRGKT